MWHDSVPPPDRHRTAKIACQSGPMSRFAIELLAALSLTLGAVLASAPSVKASDVLVSSAVARASISSLAKSGVAYLTIVNQGAAADRLLSVSTLVAASAALHGTRMDGDIMRMEEAGIVELPPGGTIEMVPGGLHVMLMGLKAPLLEGEIIDLTLTFERAGDVLVRVPVGPSLAGGNDYAKGSSGG